MPTPYRFLALGDSYTIGTGVDPADSWPAQLVAQLRTRGVAISDPIIIAQNGWTAGNLLKALDETDISRNFDLVSLLIGVNDQYDGISPKEYHRNFKGLLKRVIELNVANPMQLITLSIPDWSVTPFAEGHDQVKISTQIERFNTINRQETTLAGVHYIEISYQAANDSNFFAEDGLHPSGTLYTAWVERLLPVVNEILQI